MRIRELVKNCTRIGLTGHENPDGDCTGACCGLALYLRKILPEAPPILALFVTDLPTPRSLNVLEYVVFEAETIVRPEPRLPALSAIYPVRI